MMKKIIPIILVAFTLHIFVVQAVAQDKVQDKVYTIMFYNVENLFDTIPSPNTDDKEFTPGGVKSWNAHKYSSKMQNLEKVFAGIAQQERTFPAIIGLSEVENRRVLEDLVSMPALAKAGYQIVHSDSPDERGVDVALLYRGGLFRYEGSTFTKTVVEGMPDFRTRDILSVWGTIDGERFHFFVCHFPSRLGGQAASEPKRMAAAAIIRHMADSIMSVHPQTNIVIMGDTNDNPGDKSLAQVIGGEGKPSKVPQGGFFNPFREMHRAGFGSNAYNDEWSLFDNIIVSENLLNGAHGKFKLHRKGKYYGYIFNKPFMVQRSGQYKGYPLRTFVSDNFQNGYSDHFPVYIIISNSY